MEASSERRNWTANMTSTVGIARPIDLVIDCVDTMYERNRIAMNGSTNPLRKKNIASMPTTRPTAATAQLASRRIRRDAW